MTAAGGFGYLGWIGHDNLGDDAIADVLGEQLRPIDIVAVPTTLRATLDVDRQLLAERRLLLGGGTAIGRANWRLQVWNGLRLCHGGQAVMIGAAVEDPSFRGRRSFSSFGELRRWRHVLNDRFERVTVRGPRSARLLEAIGVEARVVGDPALMAAMSARRDPDGPIVVSLGYGDALRGGDQDAVVATVAAALDRWDVRPVVAASVNPGDRQWAQQLRQRLGDRVRCVDAFSLDAFDAAIDGASTIVAERLHAGILAAAAEIVPVLLAYQPKVDDFAESIGLTALATDALDPERLCAALDTSVDGATIVATADRVDALVRALHDEVAWVHALLGSERVSR